MPWIFTHWYDENGVVSTNKYYQFRMPKKNHTITGNFMYSDWARYFPSSGLNNLTSITGSEYLTATSQGIIGVLPQGTYATFLYSGTITAGSCTLKIKYKLSKTGGSAYLKLTPYTDNVYELSTNTDWVEFSTNEPDSYGWQIEFVNNQVGAEGTAEFGVEYVSVIFD